MLIEPQTALQEERKLLQAARIKQARHLANAAAKRIRDRVRFTRDTLQKEAEDEVFRQLVARQMAMIETAAQCVEATYQQEVGRAYAEADLVARDEATVHLLKNADAKRNEQRATKRYEEAKAFRDAERAEAQKDEVYRRIAKKSALEAEMERTKAVLARPPPQKSEVEKVAAELEETKRRPFRVLESNVYQTTRYHLGPDLIKEAEEPVVKPHVKKVNRVKVTSSSHPDHDDDDQPQQNVPQPTTKEPILPLVEKPASLDQAKSVTRSLDVDAENEAVLKKRRDEMEERARVRGETALKQERDSRHFEKLLSDLTTLQHVWRRHDLASQPHVIAGRLYVGADHVEAEKRAQQNRLEAAFNPIVRAAAATKNLPPIIENEPLTLSPKSPKSESTESESAVGTGSGSSLSSFCWQEASVSTEEGAQEQTLVGGGEKSESSCSDYVAHEEESSSGSVSESTDLTTEPPPLEQQSLSPEKFVEPPRPLTGQTTTTISSGIETGPLPNIHLGISTTNTSDSSSISAGTLSSTESTLIPQPPPLKEGTTSSYDWLMEHNRLLMAKIDSHRRQIEDQRVALARRLEQLNVRVASPLRVSTQIRDLQRSISTGGSASAPSTLDRANLPPKTNEGDDSVIAFSPSHSSSFLSDITPRRLPPFLNYSGSANSSQLSTGPLQLSNSSSSSNSSPPTPAQPPKPTLAILPEHEHEMSLLVEKTDLSSVSGSMPAGQVPKMSNLSSSNELSSLGSLMRDYYASRPSGSSGSSGDSSKQTAPPVLPALSSTPRREESNTTSSKDTTEQSKSDSANQSPPIAFRSLLLEADDAPEDEDVDDFDLPPPSLVGDESFLNQLPQ